MAKAKKQQTAEEMAAAGAAPAGGKKAAGKKPAKAAKSAVPAKTGVPQIDTSLAAQTAARLVANKDLLGNSQNAPERKQESSSFKQLKESLNKPAGAGPASFLQNTAPSKKANTPFSGFNQVGRNQTFGADVNRTGVPRRTGG